MEETMLISIMATLIILAAFLSIVMNKIRMPALIGFLVAGILIANFMDLSEDGKDIVEVFSNLGLIMLMFAIGMEIDLGKLRSQGRFALVVALVQMPLMILGGVVVGMLLGYNMVQSICLGAIISGSSTAVVIAVLHGAGTLTKDRIEVLVLVMIMEDIAQVIMLSMLTPMLNGSDMDMGELLVLIGQVAVFMILCFTLGLKLVPKIINFFYARSNDELISLLCIGALFTLSLAASKMGLSVAIGAFLMGIIVGVSKPKEAVVGFVKPLESLFMAMFFISIGMEVAIGTLVDNIIPILIIFATFAICKTLSVYLGYWIGNGNSRDGFISAVSLCAMGEFAFIIAKQALDLGAVDTSFYSSVIGAAMVSMVVLPILSKNSGRAFDGFATKAPGLMARFGRLSARRDAFYNDMGKVPKRARDMYSNGAISIYINIILIVIIELAFHLFFVDVVFWIDEQWEDTLQYGIIALLALNFLLLIYPLYSIVRSLRQMLYVRHIIQVQEGRAVDDPEKAGFHETMDSTAIACALAVLIVVLLPDDLEQLYELAIGIGVVIAVVAYQYYRVKTGRKSKPIEIPEDDSEDGESSGSLME